MKYLLLAVLCGCSAIMPVPAQLMPGTVIHCPNGNELHLKETAFVISEADFDHYKALWEEEMFRSQNKQKKRDFHWSPPKSVEF